MIEYLNTGNYFHIHEIIIIKQLLRQKKNSTEASIVSKVYNIPVRKTSKTSLRGSRRTPPIVITPVNHHIRDIPGCAGNKTHLSSFLHKPSGSVMVLGPFNAFLF